ncbi:hypothetical protein DXA95_17410 [Odoribacter sp. OF09-27XD]|nr:hypothetical protein [Odoribacter sp. OF09-27XD]RHV86628.1 hypothetical protein DXA95_17410 [Odoribacter sp. OF09-27XD]
MKINYLNKWGGFFWGPSPIAQTMRYRIFRDLIVFTSAIVICCIVPWESAGIKEDYYLFLKKNGICSIGFVRHPNPYRYDNRYQKKYIKHSVIKHSDKYNRIGIFCLAFQLLIL